MYTQASKALVPEYVSKGFEGVHTMLMSHNGSKCALDKVRKPFDSQPYKAARELHINSMLRTCIFRE